MIIGDAVPDQGMLARFNLYLGQTPNHPPAGVIDRRNQMSGRKCVESKGVAGAAFER